MPGRASYSAMIATRGPRPVPGTIARNAVGTPPTPRSTRSPRFSRNSVSQPWAFSSLKQSSGLAWICSDSPSSSSARASTAATTRAFVSSRPLTSSPLEVLLHASEQAGIAKQVDGGHGHGLGRGQETFTRQRSDRRRFEGARVDRSAVGGDLHQRLDRRYHLADIANVRRAKAVLHLGRFSDAQRGEIGPPDGQQRLVALHRLVRVLVVDDLQDAFGGAGGALGAGDDARGGLPHLLDLRRPPRERRGGELRDEGGSAAATPRGGRADDVDPAPGKPLAHGGQAQAGAGAGRGDHVVTASVADTGQCVVLTHDGDRRPIARVQRGPERGVDASDAALDLEALGAEELDEPAGRLDFLVAELGMVVDLAGELFQLIARPVQRAGDLILDGAHARTSVGVSEPAHYTPSVVWCLPPRGPWSRGR